jgi:hypothetical protein
MADRNLLPEDESIFSQDIIENPEEVDMPQKTVSTVAQVGAAGLGLLSLLTTKKSNYIDLTKLISEQSEAAVKQWKKAEEELSKNPQKNIDPNRAKNEAEVKERHLEKAYDSFARISNKQAKKWAGEHPEDIYLAQAVDRIEIERKNLTFEEYHAIRNRYAQRASKNGYTPEQVELLKNKASGEFDSLLVRNNPGLANKWIRENGDSGIVDAVNKKRLADLKRAKEEQSRISRLLGLDPTGKYSTPVSAPAPQATMKITPKPNMSSQQTTPPSSPRERAPGRFGSLATKRKGAGVINGLNKTTAKALARSPMLWPIILAIVGFFLFLIFVIVTVKYSCDHFWDDPVKYAPIAFIGSLTGACTIPSVSYVVPPENPPGITTLFGEPLIIEVSNEDNITFTINITRDAAASGVPDASKVSIFFVSLFDFRLVSADGSPVEQTDSSGNNYLEWKLSDILSSGSTSTTIKVTIDPVVEDYIGTVAVYASTTGYKPPDITYPDGGTDGPTTSTGDGVKECRAREPSDVWYGADCPPTRDTCGGKYTGIDDTMAWLAKFPKENPQGEGGNFGDPLCSYKQAKATAIIDELEPVKERAAFWKDIVSCEGGVNSYGRQIHPDTGRPNGPAGMFQMNIGNPIFAPWKPGGSLLRGDVPWQRQIQNAINNNNDTKSPYYVGDFGFYGSAMCLCWWPGYREKDYCRDILRKGINSYAGPRAPLNNCPHGPEYLPCETAVRCQNDHCNSLGKQGPSL